MSVICPSYQLVLEFEMLQKLLVSAVIRLENFFIEFYTNCWWQAGKKNTVYNEQKCNHVGVLFHSIRAAGAAVEDVSEC